MVPTGTTTNEAIGVANATDDRLEPPRPTLGDMEVPEVNQPDFMDAGIAFHIAVVTATCSRSATGLTLALRQSMSLPILNQLVCLKEWNPAGMPDEAHGTVSLRCTRTCHGTLTAVWCQVSPRASYAFQWRMTVRLPCRMTRLSQCHRTALDKALHSVSRPAAARSSGVWAWSTSCTCCEMIGPSSSSALT